MESSQPILLPSELEDKIFAMAAGDLSSAFQLLQVSHRVYNQVLPILYHTMDLEREEYYPKVVLFPPPGFEHTRRLILTEEFLKPGRVIREFPNASHLLLWINNDTREDHIEVIDAIKSLPLKWIAAGAPNYYWSWSYIPEYQTTLFKGDYGWNTTLTHFSVDHRNCSQEALLFEQYPRLTHLIVHFLASTKEFLKFQWLNAIPSLLQRETFSLCLLLCLNEESDDPNGDLCEELQAAVWQLGWSEKCSKKVVVLGEPLANPEENFWDCEEDLVQKAEEIVNERARMN